MCKYLFSARFVLAVALLPLALGGCGFLKTGNEDYSDSASTKPLEAPPDLVTPDWEDSLRIPRTAGDRVSALQTQVPAVGASVLPEFLEMRVRKEGPTRWLEVDTDPVTLWPLLRRFWQEEGFRIAEDEPALGYMETHWAQDQGRLRDASSNREGVDVVTEKFRIRLERQPNAVTNLYLTRRGLEVAAVNADDQILWKPQPPNPDREAEMTVRLMEFLGISKEEAALKFASPDSRALYLDIRNIEGIPVLMVGDVFPRVWRRTGVALDRSGLVIEDHNRDKGIYFVSMEPDPVSTEAGVQDGNAIAVQYQIHLLSQGSQTLITAHKDGQEQAVIPAETARKLLRRIISAYPGNYPRA